MVYKLREADKEWIEKAIDKQITPLQMIRKLEQGGYNEEMIDAFQEYFMKQLTLSEKEETRDVEDEKKFEKDVKKYTEDPSKVSYLERRKIKKWFKNIEKYMKVLDGVIKGIKKEVVEIDKKFGKDSKKIEKEMENLKLEIIDRIIDSKDILIIMHPYNKDIEATKENLKDVELDDLIELMEENKQELELIINGKV